MRIVTSVSWVGVVMAGFVAMPSLAQVAGPPFEIYGGPGDQLLPYAAYDSVNQRFLVVWVTWDQDNRIAVYGQALNADGSCYGSLIPISDRIGKQQHWQGGWGSPIAYEPASRRFLIVWQDNRHGYWVSYGQLINSDGSAYGQNFAISPAPPEPYHLSGGPMVVVDTIHGAFLVVWKGMTRNYFGRVVRPDGSFGGSMRQLTSYDSGYGGVDKRIVFDENHARFFFCWTYDVASDMCMSGRFLNPDASFQGQEVPLRCCGAVGGMSCRVVHDGVNDRFLVHSWTSDGEAGKAQLVDANGSLQGQDWPMSKSSVGFDARVGKYLCAPYHGCEISGQMYNADGSSYGPPFPIWEEPGWETRTQIAVGTGGTESLFVWEGLSDRIIYGAFVAFVRYPGDFDNDGDVDTGDFRLFQACVTGPDLMPLMAGCEPKDFDRDGDVDQSDFGVFQRCYSGENLPVDARCAGG